MVVKVPFKTELIILKGFFFFFFFVLKTEGIYLSADTSGVFTLTLSLSIALHRAVPARLLHTSERQRSTRVFPGDKYTIVGNRNQQTEVTTETQGTKDGVSSQPLQMPFVSSEGAAILPPRGACPLRDGACPLPHLELDPCGDFQTAIKWSRK